MQILKCLHTAVPVSDLAKSEHFYGVVLGLVKVDRQLRFPGAWYQVDDYQIHLIQVDRLEKLPNDLPEKWGRGHHMALSVADLETAKQDLRSHGCEVQVSASGRAALFVLDPDRNIIELSENRT